MNSDIIATGPVISLTFGFIVIVFLTSFIGAAIQSITGFGYAVILMAILPLLIPDLSVAVAATGIITTIQSTISAWRYRKGTQWKLLPSLLVCFVVTNFLAIRFAATHPLGILRRPMGAFLILLAVYFIFFSGKIKIKGNPVTGCMFGCISGIAGGFFSIPGPPMALYLLSVTPSNAAYMATLQTFFFCTGISTTLMRFANGQITTFVLMVIVPAIAGLLTGRRIGTRLFDKLDPIRLRRLVYALMAVSGLWILITG